MFKRIRQLLNGKETSASEETTSKECDTTSLEEREQIVARSILIQQKLREQLGKTTP